MTDDRPNDEGIASQLAHALETVLVRNDGDVAATYTRVASDYARFRDLWLQLAGQEAEDELFRDLAEVVAPGTRVLDAGCGTGALARQVHAMQPEAALTMLDLTPAMLEHARDVPGTYLVGDVQALPFPDASFDVVMSGWVLETVPDPKRAAAEFLRVLAPGGHVLYCFCSLPDGWLSRSASLWLRKAVHRGFAGSFLDREEMPAHDCDRSRILRFGGGLTTLVVLRKCCSVTADALPIPMEEVPPTML